MEAETTQVLARRRALLARLARPAGEAPLTVFCSGIGGTGLSGLARLLTALGHRVRGSDRSPSPLSQGLEAAGVAVVYEQAADNVTPGDDLFVATAALPSNHPELVAAIRHGVPVVKYAEALGALVSARRGVAIAGTHGKTTTTALTAYLLAACERDPSWVIGGQPRELGHNAGLGGGPELVLEACEFDRSFRHYVPSIAVVLNVEEDHLDCYRGGLDEIVEAFVEFGTRIKEGGALLVSADWPHALRVAELVQAARPDIAVETFGLDAPGRFTARDLVLEDGLPRFDLVVDGEVVAPVRLSIPGRHNVTNALAALAAVARAGVDLAAAARAVSGFTGVRRRFDLLHAGPDVLVVDDYAHHPTAVRAVLAAARSRYPDRRLVAVFEPHQASRTRHLLEPFAEALALADRVLLGEIYACRDRPEDLEGVSAGDLAARVDRLAPAAEARCAGDPAALEEAALALLRPGDVGLFLGAGRVSGVAHRVAERLAGADPLPPALAARSGRVTRLAVPLEVALARALGDRLRLEAPLGPHCTLRAGGRARFLLEPRDADEAIACARRLQRAGVPLVPLGGGSNTLFTGPRFDGAVLLTRGLSGARVLGATLRAGAGAPLQGVLRLAEEQGLGGLEDQAGIPGTLGGAVFGNAGGPPGAATVGDRVTRVRVLEPDGRVRWRAAAALGLRYRGSELDGCLILEVDLALRPACPAELRRRRLATARRKAAVQPLAARSAGCTFRNPPGESAGRLIDRLGLKGLRRGGAVVSELHGNFVVNDGHATPADVVALIHEVQARVLAATGVVLEPELRLLGR